MRIKPVQTWLFAAFLVTASSTPAAKWESSKALRLTVPEFVDGKHDLVVILLYREGRFHNAYASVPGRDNLVHRVDPTPAHPFEYVYTDGRKPKVDITSKKMTGTYAYWHDEWKELREDPGWWQAAHHCGARTQGERQGTGFRPIDVPDCVRTR